MCHALCMLSYKVINLRNAWVITVTYTYADVVDFVVKLFEIIRMLAQVVNDVRREKDVNKFRCEPTGKIANAHRINTCK